MTNNPLSTSRAALSHHDILTDLSDELVSTTNPNSSKRRRANGDRLIVFKMSRYWPNWKRHRYLTKRLSRVMTFKCCCMTPFAASTILDFGYENDDRYRLSAYQ